MFSFGIRIDKTQLLTATLIREGGGGITVCRTDFCKADLDKTGSVTQISTFCYSLGSSRMLHQLYVMEDSSNYLWLIFDYFVSLSC